MKIVISSGHGKYISGAVGPSPWGIHEHTEAVKVVDQAAAVMRSMGVEVITYEDTVSTSQSSNLDRIVDFHNAQGSHDLDVSIHFNSTDPQPSGPVGSEVFYGSSAGKTVADRTVDEICTASGLKNRGPKDGSGFAFINGTNEVAVLVEVCFVNSHADCDIYRNKFSEICVAIAEGLTAKAAQPGPGPSPPDPGPTPPDPGPSPPDPGPDETPTLKKGSVGPDVIVLQKALGVLLPDGDFGSITDTWVRAFQASCDLKADGVVGEMTWEEVDDLVDRVTSSTLLLPKNVTDEIYTMAQTSELAEYSWKDRGVPPPGYIAGMSLCFAHAVQRLHDGDDAAALMATAAGDPSKDALAWYKNEFAAQGMSNKTEGVEALRHLFVMMIGLGPRESSGKYCEGRDLAAENMASDTCEAGLFQTSWNIRSFSPFIAPLLTEFWESPIGFLEVFKEGISPTTDNLNSYGSGDGVRYQWLSRFCPLFHVLVTGCGMRVAKDHWGPIKTRAVEIKREADALLKDVQALVEVGGSSEIA
jgi:hypothetical protein